MAQLIPIVSDALQASIRRLLPSQNGFGEDLQASNVITPIIDLTPTAEGSSVPAYLTNALAFGSQTSFSFSNSSGVVVASTGFWQVTYVSTIAYGTGGVIQNVFQMSDGLSNKTVWKHSGGPTGAGNVANAVNGDLIVFLGAGDSISGSSTFTSSTLAGSVRQIADVNGVLVNPVGFDPQ